MAQLNPGEKVTIRVVSRNAQQESALLGIGTDFAGFELEALAHRRQWRKGEDKQQQYEQDYLVGRQPYGWLPSVQRWD